MSNKHERILITIKFYILKDHLKIKKEKSIKYKRKNVINKILHNERFSNDKKISKSTLFHILFEMSSLSLSSTTQIT